MTSKKIRARFDEKPSFNQTLKVTVQHVPTLDKKDWLTFATLTHGIAEHTLSRFGKHSAENIRKQFNNTYGKDFEIDVNNAIGFCYWTLEATGLYNGAFRLEPNLLAKFENKAGEKTISEMKANVGENYEIAVLEVMVGLAGHQFEPEWYAASILAKIFISDDLFGAGVLYSELENRLRNETHVINATKFKTGQVDRARLGGLANREKSNRRKIVFQKIALDSFEQWVTKSGKHQVRMLKKFCLKWQDDNYENLFSHGNKSLSNNWFESAITELRQSGQLEDRLETK